MFIHNGGGTKLEVMNYGKIQNVLVLHDIQYIVHTTEFVGNFLIKAAPPPPACALALAGKFKKWSKNLGSVLKRCEYDVRSTKKNLGSIGGSLEEPQPKHVHWCLAQRFAHCMSFARQFADLKNFTRYV